MRPARRGRRAPRRGAPRAPPRAPCRRSTSRPTCRSDACRRRGRRRPSSPALDRPEADDDDVVVALLAQRLELGLERLADAVVLLLAGERELHARPLGAIDLPHAVADVLDAHRADEREVDEGVAEERAARAEENVLRTLAHALGADRTAREEVLAAVRAARAEQARRLGGVVGDREIAGLHRHARPLTVHRARELLPDGRRCQTAQGARVPLITATAWKGLDCPRLASLAARVLVPWRRSPLREGVTTVR